MTGTDSQGISDSHYATRTRALIKLITRLRGVGAQADVDLPRIAVIGNQSAGKSSLVEAISGITVPRSSGTCTRCPMECRLTYTPESLWRCQVILRVEFDDSTGQRLGEIREKKFGPPVTIPRMLEDVLRRAQLAILNPDVDSQKFVGFDISNHEPSDLPLGSTRQLQFSKNTVCLDLSGPEVTDLSFIDLPGIISNVGHGEDRNNIELVRNLVMEHIRGNCLILLTLTMRDDMENQSAAFLAKEVDPDGLRTIGVLTKPDTLQPGEENAWLAVLEGRKNPLHHGYYMTKQPGTQDLEKKPSFEEARLAERQFFSNTSVWSSSVAKNRLGTANLTESLSRLLSMLINKTLPKLRDDAMTSRQSTRKALDALPPALSDNPSAELLRIVQQFGSDFDNYVRGISHFEGLIQHCKPAYTQFSTDIKLTGPNFLPYTAAEVTETASLAAAFKDLEDDEELPKVNGAATPNTDKKENDDFNKNPLPRFVDEVQLFVSSSLTRELPYNVPFSAKERLILASMTAWELHAIDCFKSIRGATAKHLQELVTKHFGRFTGSSLLDNVSAIIGKLVETKDAEVSSRLKWLIGLEQRPFTQNFHYLSSYRDKYMARYRGERRKITKGGPGEANAGEERPNIDEILGKLAAAGYVGLSAEDLDRLVPPDPFEEVLYVMAEVKAYWQVSYKRIIDLVPMVIDDDFLCGLARDSHRTLMDGLGLTGPDPAGKAAKFLAEDPDVMTQREELNQKMARVEDIWACLSEFNL